jgi:hypothetical protein
MSLRFIALVIVKETAAWAAGRVRRLASKIRVFLECSTDSAPKGKRPPVPRDFN